MERLDGKAFDVEYDKYQKQLMLLIDKYNVRVSDEYIKYQKERKDLTKTFIEKVMLMDI